MNSEILHFTTTRNGGVSAGPYASLNLSEYCGDNLADVLTNRAILCDELGIPHDALYIPRQVHGDHVLHCNSSTPKGETADALITDQPGICISIATADCVPILLFAPDRKVIAAIHAGWRGTVLNIVHKTISQMKTEYGCDPKKMLATSGPAISVEKFEVGKEVADVFLNDPIIAKTCGRHPQTKKIHIDLKMAIFFQLCHEGVLPANISSSTCCTHILHKEFFSVRRDGPNTGRILSGIMLKDSNN
jgi:YfiH family protein